MPSTSTPSAEWLQDLSSRRHRGMVVFAGERNWGRARLADWLRLRPPPGALWVGDQPLAAIPAVDAAQARQELGGEYDLVIFDAHAGFDPDAFGSVSGCVRGGGVLVLLCPALQDWPEFADPQNRRIAVAPLAPEQVSGHYLARLARLLADSPEIFLARENGPVHAPLALSATVQADSPAADADCITADQQAAVEAILHVVSGQRRRPAILTSDRGRGKSAALGIAAARLMAAGRRHILVTAPRLDSLATLFDRACALLPGGRVRRGRIEYRGGLLEFRPPDSLAEAPQDADLLLVDEAAGIPLPLLEKLLRHYSRIAFATTVHGYEGTGRGFALRFGRLIDSHSRGHRDIHLRVPIRWADKDPLEAWVFRALLLNAEPQAPTDPAAPLRIEQLRQQDLAKSEADLRSIFGLLVLAHYRTRPFDLRQLLDGPNVEIHALRLGERIAAVALIAREGEFDQATAQEIAAGRRRPRGHLLPQALAAQLGIEAAPRLRCLRIMRIAVHPQWQGRGLGSALLATVLRRDVDLIGSSFAADRRLLRFWRKAGLRPARVSVRRSASSAAHSILMIRAVSEAGKEVEAQALKRLRANLPHQLADPLRDLEADLVPPLLQAAGPWPERPLDESDRQDLADFAAGRRGYEEVMDAVYRASLAGLSASEVHPLLAEAEAERLVRRVLQRKDWSECGNEGRAALLGRIRATIAKLQAADRNEIE